MLALEVKNLTKKYKLYKNPHDRLVEIFFHKTKHKIFYANKNISFNLKEGETLGIIGLNGAGKSTLLKQISGVIDPTSGEIIRYGRVTALLELGTGFNPEFSGRENIYFNGMLLGMDKEEIASKEADIIEFSELGEFIEEPLKNYSSGMIMRLAFSIAIHSTPQILIVDEALSVGDAHFSAKCTRALKELKSQKLSIIYVSHDLNSLKLLCDRLILLHKGEIIKEGNPDEVISLYNFHIAKTTQSLYKQDQDFGNYKAKIKKVTIKGENSHSNTLTSGERGKIIVEIESYEDIEDVTIGILIRDKFGQDIFGTNTYYHKKSLFFSKDTKYKIEFEMDFNIGVGNYFVTTAIHSGENHLEDAIHWIDNAQKLEIAGIKGGLFTGLCRLEPTIKIEEL